MKHLSINTILFISKSLLLSLILYTAVVIVLDWEEMTKRITPNHEVALVNNNPMQYDAGKKMSVNEKVPKAFLSIWHHLLNISK